MKNVDVALLTESRYVSPAKIDAYIQNILDEDRLVIHALEKRGLSVVRVDWADQNFDWSSAKVALFRTTWDYFDRFEEFISWLNKTKEIVNFINPIDLILWNLDKHYLNDLSAKGINIPETIFIEAGEQTTLSKVFLQAGWQDAILKPAISGTARHTYRIFNENLSYHETIFQKLIAKETMLLQPFQQSVLKKGEVALMYFDGKYSHAVLKIAKPGDFRVQDDFGGTVHHYTPTQDEITLGQKAVQACAQIPIYARVDVIKDNYGKPAVSELELIEPELWFRFKPEAASAMADATVNYIKAL